MKWGGECVEGEGAQFVGPSNANDKMAGRINCVAQARHNMWQELLKQKQKLKCKEQERGKRKRCQE